MDEISTRFPFDSLNPLAKSAKLPPIKSKPIGIAQFPSKEIISHKNPGIICCPPISFMNKARIN
jgi:hypothetical protein